MMTVHKLLFFLKLNLSVTNPDTRHKEGITEIINP